MPTPLPRTAAAGRAVPVITLLALVAAANAAGTVRATRDNGVLGPGSCRGWRDDRGMRQDGEYQLLLAFGDVVDVYCHMMGDNAASIWPEAPFEYITLPATVASTRPSGSLVNAAQWVMGPFVTTTTFTRVRLDADHLTIRTGDFTFATTVTTTTDQLVPPHPDTFWPPHPDTFCTASQRYPVGPGHTSQMCFTQQPPAACSLGVAPAFGVPFGIAGWCSAMSDPRVGELCGGDAVGVTSAAEASIDLTGTSFVLDEATNLAVEIDFAAAAGVKEAMFVNGSVDANTTINAARDVLRTSVLYRDTPTTCAMVWDRHWLTANSNDWRSRRQGGSSIYLRPRTRSSAPGAAAAARGFGQTGFELHSYTEATASSCDGAHPVEVAAFTPTTDRVCGLPTSAPTTSDPTTSPTRSPTNSDPTTSPTMSPTSADPTVSPTTSPTTADPTMSPSIPPTSDPTKSPSISPTTSDPTTSPTTSDPTMSPTVSPTTADPTPAPNPSGGGGSMHPEDMIGATAEPNPVPNPSGGGGGMHPEDMVAVLMLLLTSILLLITLGMARRTALGARKVHGGRVCGDSNGSADLDHISSQTTW